MTGVQTCALPIFGKAVFYLLCIEPFLEMVKVDAVLYREASCLGTAEGCQEGTAIQGTTDVACQGTDVSTLTANHSDACRLLLIV